MVPPVTGGEPSARAAALEALRRADGGAGFLRDELHAVFGEMGLLPRDRALATQLATGVMRHRRTLRLVLNHLRRGDATRPIQPALAEILELGAFQLLFLDRVPAYAAVNEAVAAAGRAAKGAYRKKAAGFANAILRGVGRLVAGRDPDGRPARDALPHPEGGTVRLTAPVLPDPQADPATFLGAAYSYPDWLVASWLDAFGDGAEAICRWGNRRPHTFARVNRMRHDAADLLRRLQEKVPGAQAGPRPGSLDVSALDAARLEALIEEGCLTVQDPAAMAAVEALAPAPGESVLDLCASPGTKTTQIVEWMGDRGRVVACDRSEEKLRPIRQTVAARHLESVGVCLVDDLAGAAPAGGFDAALVDAPCSNTGVLARRVEARWRLRPDDPAELAAVQGRLLGEAAMRVRPGGRIVYSTCSLQAVENDGVVAAFLAAHQGWRVEGRELTLPGPDHDGAFWALLAR
ncbi:MAG: 16S rRNA (cytosine(967)-C(5))-methyltransferase RsmB [Planctomycetes bacterium]|nr:16S rRNA (cytosine(967)-C(5))-methyltransferase RsmB [Planctomycetota bacterium]